MEKSQPNPTPTPALRKQAAPSAQRFLALFNRLPGRHKSARFITGTALIAASFLLYLAYPIILLILPLAPSVKVGATVAVWILSWGMFSAGVFLAGPGGFEWFKGQWRRMTGNGGFKPDE